LVYSICSTLLQTFPKRCFDFCKRFRNAGDHLRTVRWLWVQFPYWKRRNIKMEEGNLRTKRKIALCLLASVMTICGCSSSRSSVDKGNEPLSDIPRSTYWPGEEWLTSSPEEQGIDSNILYPFISRLIEFKTDPFSRFDSILIVRNGYLITELYAPYKTKNDYYDLYSATKSVISALVGIAIKEGYISGVEAKAMDFFPEYRREPTDPVKEAISIRDLLRMSAGFEWNEWNNPATAADPAGEMFRSYDPVKYLLDKPIITKPGEVFNYNTGESLLLSEIITRATGMNTIEYAEKKLFQPLGIHNYTWDVLRDGVPGNLQLTSRDMAKFGFLYLNRGIWNGQQIVPFDWVEQSTTKQIDTKVGQKTNGYGFQWWMNTFGGYSAKGMFGQYICILPEWNVVAVFQSHLSIRSSDFLLPLYIVQNGIIKSIKSSKPLTSNRLGELEKDILRNQTSNFGLCGNTYGCKN